MRSQHAHDEDECKMTRGTNAKWLKGNENEKNKTTQPNKMRPNMIKPTRIG